LALLISLIASLKLLLKQRTSVVHLLNVAATIGALFTFIGIPVIVNDEAALRYSVPFLIAVAPTTIIFHRSVLAFSDDHYLRGLWQKGFAATTIACLVILIAIFVPYSVQRFSRLIRFRSVISFAVKQQVIAAEAAAMSVAKKDTRATCSRNCRPAGQYGLGSMRRSGSTLDAIEFGIFIMIGSSHPGLWMFVMPRSCDKSSLPSM
jgi:hypothetical protein